MVVFWVVTITRPHIPEDRYRQHGLRENIKSQIRSPSNERITMPEWRTWLRGTLSSNHVRLPVTVSLDDNVDGARQRLWTAATNGPTFHPPGYIGTERTIVEWHQHGKTPDSSIRAAWKSHQQSSSSKAGGTVEGSDGFCLTRYLFHTSKRSLTCRKILRYEADCFTSPPKKGVLQIFIALGGVWTHEPWGQQQER
jgi:hypothetical protein